MTFFFGFLDILLTIILLFDTLGLAYQIRKEADKLDKRQYIRVCLSWILFLTICYLFTFNGKGFFYSIIRLLFFFAKAFVVLPICGGTLKIYDYLIEKENAKQLYYSIVGKVKSKLCKEGRCPNVNNISETIEPENIVTPQ